MSLTSGKGCRHEAAHRRSRWRARPCAAQCARGFPLRPADKHTHLALHPPSLPTLPGSVLFFSSLVLVGFGLPKFVKQPLGRAASKVKGWFRRRPAPPKLQPPAPAAKAVAQSEEDKAAEPAAAPASS